jgi:dihydroorotase-like cyclic amidohydrolase
MASKKQYESPTLTVVGTFESITQAAQSGGHTDALFPPNTPFGDLTFS